MLWKCVPELFIASWIFAFIWVFSSVQLVLHCDFILRNHYKVIMNLMVWSFTLTLVVQVCLEYHLTWAWVLLIGREFQSVCMESGVVTLYGAGHTNKHLRSKRAVLFYKHSLIFHPKPRRLWLWDMANAVLVCVCVCVFVGPAGTFAWRCFCRWCFHI